MHVFRTKELIEVEKKLGVGNIQKPNLRYLIISSSVKNVLHALQSFKMSGKEIRLLADEITKLYPSLLDINKTNVGNFNEYLLTLSKQAVFTEAYTCVKNSSSKYLKEVEKLLEGKSNEVIDLLLLLHILLRMMFKEQQD